MDEGGNPIPVKKWIPQTENEKQLQAYAKKLVDLREQINTEMKPFFDGIIDE